MIKIVNDYYELLYEKFPDLPKEDIRRAVKYGWRMFYYYTVLDCDIVISSSREKFWMHCGYMNADPLEHFAYYRDKMGKKLKALFYRNGLKWDGYYYTAIKKDVYDDFVKSKNNTLVLKDLFIFKLYDEARLFYKNNPVIIRFKYDLGTKRKYRLEDCRITDPEVVQIRKGSLNMLDLMLTTGNYKFYEKGSH